MMNEQQEYNELKAYVKAKCNSSQFRNELDADDVVQDLYCLYMDSTLEEKKAKVREVMNKQLNDKRKFSMDPEWNDRKVKQCNETTRTKCARDKDYAKRLKEQKNKSAKKQRENNAPSYQRKKARQVTERALHKIEQKSPDPILCILQSKNKCKRKPHRNHYNHKTCPLAKKFCLVGEICHPIKR